MPDFSACTWADRVVRPYKEHGGSCVGAGVPDGPKRFWNSMFQNRSHSQAVSLLKICPSRPNFQSDWDVCERRRWRIQRAIRSGRIKAIGECALHTMTEPLIQQSGRPVPTGGLLVRRACRPGMPFRKAADKIDLNWVENSARRAEVVAPYGQKSHPAVGGGQGRPPLRGIL